jgi:hypothetical protein
MALQAWLPEECGFILITQTREGGAVDSNVPREKLIQVIEETLADLREKVAG